MCKTYHPIPWATLSWAQRDEILEWSHIQERIGKGFTVYCSYCCMSIDIREIPDIVNGFTSSVLTVEEQEHMDSEAHITNATLVKLAGEVGNG